jgi:hypothetical protein
MRKLALLLLLAVICPAVFAATPVTVDQLEQLLPALHLRRDADAARQLAGLELTERASSARLARWEAGFQGNRVRATLLALVDAAAFRDLPPAEVPSLPPPERSAQRQILTRAVLYVRNILPKLPDFSAQRGTTRFEISTLPVVFRQQLAFELLPFMNAKMVWRSLGPVKSEKNANTELFLLGASADRVVYRDRHEVMTSQNGKIRKPDSYPFGLVTSGEFGPILGVVVGDALRGSVTWGRWEQGAAGPLAVFRYAVPGNISRFSVYSSTGDHRQFPPYHGEITVDPASGTIRRLTLVAQLKPADPISEASLMVEFGPVVIGERTYVCPLRGVAISGIPASASPLDPRASSIPSQLYINDISFTRYHVFGSEIHILPENSPAP